MVFFLPSSPDLHPSNLLPWKNPSLLLVFAEERQNHLPPCHYIHRTVFISENYAEMQTIIYNNIYFYLFYIYIIADSKLTLCSPALALLMLRAGRLLWGKHKLLTLTW